MMRLGHIRDTATHKLAVPIRHLLGASNATLPEEITLPARIWDQGAENCTDNYGIMCETWCAARSIQCAQVSCRFSYTLGREISAGDATVALVDQGCDPASVIEGMRTVGVATEAVCPGDGPDVINVRVYFAQLEVAYKVTQIATISSDGAQRCADIRAALAQSYPVGFGATVTDDYQTVGADGLYAGTGQPIGGHAQRIVGYKPGYFLVANSWGTGWGAGGFAWWTDEQIGGGSCYDFYALDFAPAVS